MNGVKFLCLLGWLINRQWYVQFYKGLKHLMILDALWSISLCHLPHNLSQLTHLTLLNFFMPASQLDNMPWSQIMHFGAQNVAINHPSPALWQMSALTHAHLSAPGSYDGPVFQPLCLLHLRTWCFHVPKPLFAKLKNHWQPQLILVSSHRFTTSWCASVSFTQADFESPHRLLIHANNPSQTTTHFCGRHEGHIWRIPISWITWPLHPRGL